MGYTKSDMPLSGRNYGHQTSELQTYVCLQQPLKPSLCHDLPSTALCIYTDTTAVHV